jgi:hypothetical protein
MTTTCLCGAVSVTIDAKPAFINDCNCSLCRKTGGAWGYFAPASVTASGETATYSRADKSSPAVDIHSCTSCGTTTHWTRTDAFIAQYQTNDMVGVNMRLFDPEDLTGVEVRYPDGKAWTGGDSFGYRRAALTISETTRW